MNKKNPSRFAAMTTNMSDNHDFADEVSSNNKNVWKSAIQREFAELSEQGTWLHTGRPRNVCVLPCKCYCRNEKTSQVDSVVCRFYESFGGEDSDCSEGEETCGSNRKRAKTTNNQHYNESFRTDNIKRRLKEQHPKKYSQYREAKSNQEEDPARFKNLFAQSLMESFFDKKSRINGGQRIVSIRREDVDVIVKEMLFD
jgi:hypothetical protein